MKKAICFLLIFVAGCFDMNAVMNSWEGCHIKEVIAQWGFPDHQQEIAGRTIYRWDSRDPIHIPQYSTITESISPSGNFYGSTYSTNSYDTEMSCTRILEVNDAGYVIGWQWEGGKCNNMHWMNKNRDKTKDNRTTASYTLPDLSKPSVKFDTAIDQPQIAPEQQANNVQQYPEQSEPNKPIRKIKGYKAERDLKTGKMKIYPIYENEQKK